MAGDLEDDDEDDDDGLLHDRESWGHMRKSRNELEALCKELQDTLRNKNEEFLKLKKAADQATMKMLDDQKHSEEKLQEEREKAERLAKRMEESMQTEEQLRQELSDVMISRASDKIVSVELENEIEVVHQREAEASKVTKEVEYEIFYPYYEWKNIKKNQKALQRRPM